MFRSRRYRVDNEQLVLALTVLLVGAVIVLTSSVTFCLSGVFILGMFAISAFTIRAHHRALMHSALPVNEVQTPELDRLVRACSQKLQPGSIDVYLVKKNQLNAYTFGISEPKALVIYTPMVQVMTPGELSFVVGHEMGHVALGHTWLNTILGGMAGIPGALWRGGAALCLVPPGGTGCVNIPLTGQACWPVVTSIWLSPRWSSWWRPTSVVSRNLTGRLAMIDAQDDNVSNVLAEAFQSHPMLIRRINKLREYVQTAEYRQMQAGVNGNLGQKASSPAPTVQVREEPRETAEAPAVLPAEPPKDPEERWPWLKEKDE